MGFTVTLQPSGTTFDVADGKSILTGALEAGHALKYGCRAGACQTCKSRVVAGQIDYGHVMDAFLPEEERKKGYALICQARPRSNVVLEAEELKGLALVRPRVVPGRVSKLDRVASDVMVMHVRVPMNENLLFLAGQNVDFLLDGGQRRTYSIANVPKPEGVTELEFHLRHMANGFFTDRVFSSMKVRELVKIEAPLGTFFIREDSEKPMIFIAGGTGFAPIKSMLQHAFDRAFHKRRAIHFYWGARTREGLYMLDQVNRWGGQYENFTFTPVLSDPTTACDWNGRTGLVHEAVLEDRPNLSNYQVYVSGAPGMVEAVRRDLVSQRGLDEKELFADAFLPASTTQRDAA
ncbi:CDP-6-deoxy-delta-3,4-glucoseen reductase [Bradyrhizobium jicamae]|uniref:CDP-6-deoxy-delta-3,4-glucoseen reductase n=1 Tax=Bradyrhizobium jicamae TaxID=280332 RepID=UPI001BA806AF|nr:CDP-6-deoxy-delta-3,4-glucoseen reductase [Bradyrhizobium jicamae]MBR0754347.1 CDP-6-deoxy-delta-3,4-glucoseen reductase [Bradyrhizobium jicamae]